MDKCDMCFEKSINLEWGVIYLPIIYDGPIQLLTLLKIQIFITRVFSCNILDYLHYSSLKPYT